MKKKPMLDKYQKCKFECERKITMNKHINTKHSEEKWNAISNKYEHMVNENHMF